MPYTTLVVFTAGATLPAADLNANFANSDYLRYAVNAQFILNAGALTPLLTLGATPSGTVAMATYTGRVFNFMDFADTGGTLYAGIAYPLPADYNGSTITAKFYWTANSTSANSVVWGIQGVSVADNETLDVTSGTAQTVTDAHNAAAYKLNISAATSAITLGGTPAAGELVSWVIYRDSSSGSDTLAATARLIAVVLSYTRT